MKLWIAWETFFELKNPRVKVFNVIYLETVSVCRQLQTHTEKLNRPSSGEIRISFCVSDQL